MKKEEIVKTVKEMNLELYDLYDLLNSNENEIIKRFSDCKLKKDDVNAFLIGYVRGSIKYIIEKLIEIE